MHGLVGLAALAHWAMGTTEWAGMGKVLALKDMRSDKCWCLSLVTPSSMSSQASARMDLGADSGRRAQRRPAQRIVAEML